MILNYKAYQLQGGEKPNLPVVPVPIGKVVVPGTVVVTDEVPVVVDSTEVGGWVTTDVWVAVVLCVVPVLGDVCSVTVVFIVLTDIVDSWVDVTTGVVVVVVVIGLVGSSISGVVVPLNIWHC